MKGITKAAIQEFLSVERKKRLLEESETKLNDLICCIPNEDMDEFVEITEKIRKFQLWLRNVEEKKRQNANFSGR